MAKKSKAKKATKAKVAKKPAAKKAAPAAAKVRPAAPSIKNVKIPAVTKPRTKSETLNILAESTGLTRRDISGVLDALDGLIGHDLKKGPGIFTVPGLMKIMVIHKPATKARKGINPFTGEEAMFKAKPARNVVKVRALKGLKDKVQ